MLRSMNSTHGFIGCIMILYLMVYCNHVIRAIGICSIRRRVKCHQMPLLMTSNLVSDASYRS